MSSPTLLVVTRSVATTITSPPYGGSYPSGNQPGNPGLGYSEIISLIGVLIAFLTGVAGIIGWKYKKRCMDRELQNQPPANTETEMEYAHPGAFYEPISRTTPDGYINVWIQVPRQLPVPAAAVTSSGRITEMEDLEGGRQDGVHTGSQGFILPERVAREPWHRWFR